MQKEISLDKIVLSNDQPRKEFPRNSLKELADSIEENGLLQAILVRNKGKKYELVFGERRLKAYKLLKKKTIKAEIRTLTDKEVKVIRLIENLQREKVHPLDEAKSILELLEDPKQSIETIAGILAKGKSYIAERIQLNKLITEAHKAFAEGKIELGHALLICKLPETEQQKIWKYIEQQFRVPTVSDLKNHIAGSFMPNLHLAPFNCKDKLLHITAGNCNDCPKRTGNAEDLFTDFSGKNLCTDLSCYVEKIRLHIEQRFERAAAEGKPIIKISNNYETKKDVIGFRDYEVTKKAEGKNIVKAIYIAGPEKGKVVNVVLKTQEKKEEEKRKEPTEKEKLEDLNNEIKANRDKAFRNALGTAILELPLNDDILIPLAKAIFLNESNMQPEDFFDYGEHGIHPLEVMKMNDTNFIELFNRSAIKQAMNVNLWYDELFLLEVAQRFGVDEKAIRNTIEEELPLLKKLPDAPAPLMKGETEKAK